MCGPQGAQKIWVDGRSATGRETSADVEMVSAQPVSLSQGRQPSSSTPHAPSMHAATSVGDSVRLAMCNDMAIRHSKKL